MSKLDFELEKDVSNETTGINNANKNKIIAGFSALVVVSIGALSFMLIRAERDGDKKEKDALLEGYLQGSGFNRAGLPIDVSGGATHLVVSCTPSTTDLETITNPKIEFNIDESGNAYLIDEPLKDAAGTALGEAVVIPIPLISPEDVSAFIAGDLTKFCIAVTN